MENGFTKLDIQKEWKSISEEAYKRADRTHDQFGKELVLIGAGFTALTALMVNVKPDLTGICIATAFPFLAATTAHYKNSNEEHFYKAFASHALDMRDKEIANNEILKLPRIDHEIINFKRSGLYKAPSNSQLFVQFRSAIIGVAAGTAMAIVVGFSRDGYNINILGPFRKEGDATQEMVDKPAEKTAPYLLVPQNGGALGTPERYPRIQEQHMSHP